MPAARQGARGGGRLQVAKSEWLLVECFDGPNMPMSIVNKGGSPKKFLPASDLLSPAALRLLTRAVDEVRGTLQPLSAVALKRRLEVHPHVVDGQLLGVQYWSGPLSDEPAPRPFVASWMMNLTNMTALGSEEWAEEGEIPHAERGQWRSLANLFTKVETGPKLSLALKRIIEAEPGSTHQDQWVVNRDEGDKRLSHFSCRIYAASNGDKIVRGMSQDLPYVQDPDPEQLIVLEHHLLEATRDPREYRAILSLRNLQMIQWAPQSPTADTIAWRGAPGEPKPEIHPDDRADVLRMFRELDKHSPSGRVRVRGIDGGWVTIDATVRLLALDATTTAGLVQFTIVDDGTSPDPPTRV